MKIALVHDFLREYGGAERVVEALHEIWPKAPLYTSFVDWHTLGKHAYRFKDWDIRPSWVQHNWLVKKFHSPLRFIAPKIWSSFDLSEYDVVISSSGWFMCRGINMGPTGPAGRFLPRKPTRGPLLGGPSAPVTRQHHPIHICYIHHPPRNLYGYATGSDLRKYWPVRVYAAIVNFFLRHYDFETAQAVDHFIANSKETARRVEKFYRRKSTVIYPPVETTELGIRNKELGITQKKEYFLSVGRLTYSKQLDVIINACNKLKLPLKIVGTGKEEAYLRTIAKDTIEFIGSASDEELDRLYAGAKAFIFCALDEDFGIVPVEAMAHGVPVIALGQGGVLETVTEGKTGLLFDEPNPESLIRVLRIFLRMNKDWSKDCVKRADTFNKKRFQKEIKSFVAGRYRR